MAWHASTAACAAASVVMHVMPLRTASERIFTSSVRALRLGTRDPYFFFHAGMIEKALGNVDGARAHLKTALEINPRFHPVLARQARAALREMD